MAGTGREQTDLGNLRPASGALDFERGFRGIEGGRSTPRHSRSVQHCVGWLTDLKAVSQPRGDIRENVPPGIGRNSLDRNSLDRAVAANLVGLLAARPANGEERPAPHHASVKAALSAAARVPPTRTPREPEFVDSGRFHGPQVRRKAHERAGKRSLNPLSNKTLDTDRADRSVQMRW